MLSISPNEAVSKLNAAHAVLSAYKKFGGLNYDTPEGTLIRIINDIVGVDDDSSAGMSDESTAVEPSDDDLTSRTIHSPDLINREYKTVVDIGRGIGYAEAALMDNSSRLGRHIAKWYRKTYGKQPTTRGDIDGSTQIGKLYISTPEIRAEIEQFLNEYTEQQVQ